MRGDNGRVCFSTTDSEGTIQDFAGSTSVNDGQWHFVCAIYNGTDKILFVDGQEDGRLNNAHGGRTLGTGDTTRFGFLGDGSEAGSFNGNRNGYYYEGMIDELKLYNRALSSIEVQTQFQILEIPTSDEALLLSYSFDDNAIDYSGNNNDGEVHGVTATSGISGQAYNFDGQDDYIAIQKLSFSPQDPVETVSICSWVNTEFSGRRDI